MTTLRQHVAIIAKAKGFNSITDFINNWIQNGETFESLIPHLQMEYGITQSNKGYAWRLFRDYLTIPYGVEEAFWYKWDTIAKVKGFHDAHHMIQTFRNRKLPLIEMAEELGIIPDNASLTIRHILRGKRSKGQSDTSKRKYHHHHRWLGGKPGFKTKDKDGISNKYARDRWRKKLDEYGFRSLRDAVWRLKRQKLNYTEMAQLFGVTERAFRMRRQRIGLT